MGSCRDVSSNVTAIGSLRQGKKQTVPKKHEQDSMERVADVASKASTMQPSIQPSNQASIPASTQPEVEIAQANQL